MNTIFQRWFFVLHVLAYHFVKFRWQYGAVVVVYLIFKANFILAINVSDSLPNRAFLVAKGQTPDQKGQYVAYRWDKDAFYKPGDMMVKMVGGVAGQSVVVINADVYVDGDWVGTAKKASKHGIPLSPIEAGQIPPNQLFAKAPHLDSLDSRYSVTGLIGQSRVIGRAYAIF